jgi:N-acyl-D-amino-acid deacylase
MYDIVIKNGKIVDGTGEDSYYADVGIKDGRIVKISENIEERSDKTIDATNLIVSPGFIDMHSHSDFSIVFDNKAQSVITQGITTSVIGMCGASLAPVTDEKFEEFKRDCDIGAPPGTEYELPWRTFAEYLDAMEEQEIATNFVPFVGFTAVRIAGGPAYEDREPTAEEIKKMQEFVEEAMQAGAYGFSTGLIYAPQVYAKTDEVIQVAKAAARYDGLYFSHIRDEGPRLVESVMELIEIVEKSGCRGGQIAHHKASGRPNWGKTVTTLELIEEANKKGLDITGDQYPYNRSATSLITMLPPWVHEGGLEKLLERLESAKERSKIKKDLIEDTENAENWMATIGPENIYISSVKTDYWLDIEGKNLEEITTIKEKSDVFETLFDLILEEKGEVWITIRSMGEEDIHRVMKSKYTMIGCDGSGYAPTGILNYGKPHPRNYGTFPRIIRKFVKEEKLFPLVEAIRKMSGASAEKLKLEKRGLIKESYWADITIFSEDEIHDVATFEDPHQFSKGIKFVIVNGEPVLIEGKQIDTTPGKVLRWNLA